MQVSFKPIHWKFRMPIAWRRSRCAERTPFVRQHLRHQYKRSLSALSGITFACILIYLQLGFLDAVLQTATHLYSRLDFDLVLNSQEALESTLPYTIRREQLASTRGVIGVASVAPLDIGYKQWKNPRNGRNRAVLVLGIDPDNTLIQLQAMKGELSLLSRPDSIFIDTKSRKEYGFDFYSTSPSSWAQVGRRREQVVGAYELGPSLRYDGSILTGDQNFRRIFSNYSNEVTSLGLVKLVPNADLQAVKHKIEALLPGQVRVLTRREAIERDKRYWLSSTSIGYVFGIGAFMGLVVGFVIVGQIMNADVASHLGVYATLLAIGYQKHRVMSIIVRLGCVLSLLALLPSLVGAQLLYTITNLATGLPMHLSIWRILIVFALSLLMGGGSARLAAQRVLLADPAVLFR
jgi:putative ABC transport system permease protein